MLTIPATGADPATLPWTGSVSHATAKQLSCDGSLTEIVLDTEGVPLQMGHTHRLFPPHLRRAMIVRDQCCIKCGAPPSHTQVHHIAHVRPEARCYRSGVRDPRTRVVTAA
ncbi:hypothetical protein GOTRE_127_00080 [Gordonia terrae NBRC 100016]|uniref:HNH nuclease domain-containing protein n=1 Tax=Gordonia terrae NBRC 100016 TaxID=1089454 RepID=A0ABQ0HIA1_9ACTN|nr:hypothetical protein GOTRE_127_00080 [Gordonia terrae NBRC 100016]